MEKNIEKGAQREPQAVEFTVYDRADSTPVGTAGLFRISHANGTADFGIAIGERRGQGLGTEAARSCSTSHSTCCSRAMCCSRRWSGTSRVDGVRARGLSPRRRPPWAVMSRGRPTDVVFMDAVPDDFGASVLR